MLKVQLTNSSLWALAAWGWLVRRLAALRARRQPVHRSGPTGRLLCAPARPVRSPPIPPAIPPHRSHHRLTAHTTQVAPLGDITIFVDPLDGTREFVEGRVWNVQVLIGIAVRGEAAAGAVGLPFASGSSDSDAAVVYGMVWLYLLWRYLLWLYLLWLY